jgi:DNA-binding MarR family transcriptional regulator
MVGRVKHRAYDRDVATARDDLAREVWDAITAVFLSGEMHDRFHDAASAVGLPHPGSLKALMMLPADGAPSMREMAGVLRCDPSYVTNMTDALEERGYAERRVSPSDRRVKLLHLTAAGADARERARRVIAEPPSALSGLSLDELRTLTRLLHQLVATTSSSGSPEASPEPAQQV